VLLPLQIEGREEASVVLGGAGGSAAESEAAAGAGGRGGRAGKATSRQGTAAPSSPGGSSDGRGAGGSSYLNRAEAKAAMQVCDQVVAEVL
jgi:hypothetical protein